MRIFTLCTSVLFCFFLVACDDSEEGDCSEDTDCAASEKCSTDSALCVACLSSDDCETDSFCCEGSCFAVADADQFCGCAGDVGGYGGLNCAGYTLGDATMDGPTCQKDGESVTAANVREGTCGCTQSGAEECGTETATGLYGLCVMVNNESGGSCILQGTENCGAVGVECNTSTGGPLCLPEGETGLGACSCDGNNNNCQDTVMDDQGNLHSVANNCSFENLCVCASTSEACNFSGAEPDCCGDGCFDLLSDKENCGICGKSCGENGCVKGACACSDNDECYTDAGTFNNPGTIANECIGASGTELGACACTSYRDGAGTATPCPLGSFCCFAGGDISANGCCSKACSEATLDDCTQAVP